MAVEISTVEELQAMQNDLSGDYVLVNDIDASATAGWNSGAGLLPIVNFSGSLDGAGFTIDGLFINHSTHGSGLFGRTGTSNFSGLLKNIRFTNLHIKHEGALQYAGLVSDSSGIIENAGVDSGLIDVGSGWYCGLVGRAREGSVVQDCYNLGEVKSTSSDARTAGLIGRMESGSSLLRSYAAGLVNATNGGGAVGTSSGMVTGCFWDTQATGKASSAGGTGKTTAEMKTLSTFTWAGWDIVSGLDDTKVWGIDPTINDGYPFLQVFQDAETEPTEGSGTASLIASTTGEGYTSNRGQGDTTLTTSSQGKGWRVASGDGENALSVSVVGEGYYLPSGHGESSLTLSTSGEGYAATGSYGETLLLASASGQGYVIRSGAGAAALAIGTAGVGQSVEPSITGVFGLKTSSGYFFIQTGNQ